MPFDRRSQIGLAYRRSDPPVPFGISEKDRLLHLLTLGQTGTGKSTLLENLARQDAEARRGFCLVDPHGDLAEALHRAIPQDHIYWDVADSNCPYGYNPLRSVGARFRPLVASAFIETLKKQWPEAWGARMEHLLRHAVLALLEQPQTDLRDIIKLFVFKGFRRQVIEGVTDPQVRFFWKHEYPQMNYQTSADGVAPIANKLGAFLAHPCVRTALCEPQEPLRFRALMDEGGVLLINLSKGRLGADVTNVLGGVVTSTLMHAAFSRHDLEATDRRPFFLYVDEFPNLSTRSFAGLLSEARKYGLGLVLATQHLAQMSDEVREAILGNVGALVAFRVGVKDAPLLTRLLPPFTESDLLNQPNHRAVVQLLEEGARLRPFSAFMPPPHRADR